MTRPRTQPARAPREGDRLLLHALTDAGIELVWARIEITESESRPPNSRRHHHGGLTRVGYAYEEIRPNGEVITRHNIIWLDSDWKDPEALVESFELLGD